jgi:6-phosphogluconolactonase
VSGDGKPAVAVYPDAEAVSLAAAGLFAVEARRAAAGEGSFNVALSGGSTPRRCYQILGEDPLRDSIPWQAVHLFWGDERYVPQDDPRSNFAMVRESLIRQLPKAPGGVHPIPFAESPAASAQAYDTLLHRHFLDATPRFDLVFLGLGENGHTASLFPGSAALSETVRWVREVFVPEQDLFRVTLTAPVFNAADTVAFLVTGAEKAAMLQRVLEGEYDPQRIPAQLVRPTRGKVVWLVDRAAARFLSSDTIRPETCGGKNSRERES